MGILGDLTPDDFLDRYWQKEPLLIRGAFPEFESPVSADELAGLACEQSVSSRLITDTRETGSWKVQHGPFSEQSFSNLPKSCWTLLVSDMEQWIPELHAILEPFRFLPDWRFDDLMISYAAPGGSVGPHVDHYDVFLLQAYGTRRWSISTECEPDDILEDYDLRILKHFEAEKTWDLEPGDMLYLPPGIAHHGVGINDCMTYSIGFRAPKHTELISAWLEQVIASIATDEYYDDPDIQLQTGSGEISPAALTKIRKTLTTYLLTSDEALDHWIARFVTEPKPQFAEHNSPPEPVKWIDIEQQLKDGSKLVRRPGTRFAYIREQKNDIRFFANAKRYRQIMSSNQAINMICKHFEYGLKEIKPFIHDAAFISLLAELIHDGLLYCDQ